MKQTIALMLVLSPAFVAAHNSCMETRWDSDDRLTLVSFVNPSYPDEACMNGYEGSVTLAYTILTDGTVSDIKVLRANPPGIFDESARDALAQMKYEPVQESCRASIATSEFRLEQCEDRAPQTIVIADLEEEDSNVAHPHDNELRTYTVAVTSSSREGEVQIQGSIAYGAEGGGYAQISGFTPYEISVYGLSIIAIVNATIPGEKVNIVIEMNGEEIMSGEDNHLGVFGDNTPRPGFAFASKH